MGFTVQNNLTQRDAFESSWNRTKYFYYNDQWQALAEYDASNTRQAYTVYGNYIDETLFRVDLTGAYVYAHDHLYSTVAICDFDATDGTGIVERYKYDAYGTVHVLDADFSADADGLSDVGNPYTFTGRRLDVLDSGDLNISYYRNRYYHPEIGRFMTHDPLEKLFLDTSLSFIAHTKILYNYSLIESQIANRLSSNTGELYKRTSEGNYIDIKRVNWKNFLFLHELNKYEYVASAPLLLKDPYGLVGLMACTDGCAAAQCKGLITNTQQITCFTCCTAHFAESRNYPPKEVDRVTKLCIAGGKKVPKPPGTKHNLAMLLLVVFIGLIMVWRNRCIVRQS